MAQQPSSSHTQGDGGDLVLLARRPAWGLPTACPSCLPSYLYLKLAQLDFSIHYNDVSPDAEYLPALECGNVVGYSNESGGIIGFLQSRGIANLDSGFSSDEVSQLRSFSAMIESHLQSMLLCELWDHDNRKVAHQIYFASLPWPVSKILYWKQQAHVCKLLDLNNANMELKTGEMERRAAEAYDSLSTLLGDQKFFMNFRPSSLDALFLSHALLILHVPLENSHLKEEFLSHTNLVRYAQGLQREFLDATAPLAKSVYANPTRTPRDHSAPSRTRRGQEPEVRTEKVKNFKQRTKKFIAIQILAVLAFVYIWGISVMDENAMEDYSENEYD